MRVTLHLVTAADYRAFWPAVRPGLEQQRRQQRLEPPTAEAMAALIERVTAFAAEPRSLGELREHVGDVGTLPTLEDGLSDDIDP